MEINTRDFGIIQVEEDSIYQFEEGVYGFEDVKQLALFTRVLDDVPFLNLQAVDDLFPSFLVFEPWDLYPEFKPVLTKEDMELCKIKDIEELVFLVIANIAPSIEDLSINTKSPVVLNPKTKKGRQVILQNPDYTVKYFPFKADGKAGL